jgi:hypothetical protein
LESRNPGISQVAEGLSEPVGNDAEMAVKHIVDQFAAERDRNWARRVINRANEVSAITTALFLLVLMLVLTGKIGPWSTFESAPAELLSVQQKEQLLEKKITELEPLNRDASKFLQNSRKRFLRQFAYSWLGGFQENVDVVRQRVKDRLQTSSLPAEPSNTATGGNKDDSKLTQLENQLDSGQSSAEELASAGEKYTEASARAAALKTIVRWLSLCPFCSCTSASLLACVMPLYRW